MLPRDELLPSLLDEELGTDSEGWTECDGAAMGVQGDVAGAVLHELVDELVRELAAGVMSKERIKEGEEADA